MSKKKRKGGDAVDGRGWAGGSSQKSKTHIRSSVAPDVRRPRPIKMTPLPLRKTNTPNTHVPRGLVYRPCVSKCANVCPARAAL